MSMVLPLLFCLSAGAVTAVLAARINGRVVSPAVLFWVVWSLLITFAMIAEGVGIMKEIPPSSATFALEGLPGAFAGGLLGIWLAGRVGARTRDTPAWRRFVAFGEWLGRYLTVPFLLVAVGIGVANFVVMWRTIDFDLFRLLELREAYVTATEVPPLMRLGSYLSQCGLFLLVLFGAADAEHGVRPARVLIVWMALAPYGLALANRGWTMGPLLAYGLSYFMSRGCAAARPRAPAWPAFLAMGLLGIWLFTVIGSIRNLGISAGKTEALEVGNWSDEQTYMAIGYLGGSVRSMGLNSEFAERIAPSFGEATFEYPARKLREAGAMPLSKKLVWDRWRAEVLSVQDQSDAWCTPPTAIAFLVFDFGRPLLPVTFGLLLAALHWLGTRLAGQGIFQHTVAFLATLATIVTAAELMVFNTVVVVVLFWAGVASLAAWAIGYRAGGGVRSRPAPVVYGAK